MSANSQHAWPRRRKLGLEVLENRSLPSSFQQFLIRDASGDFTEQTAFQGGALRATYEIDGVLPADTVQVTVDAWQSGVKIAVMQAFTTAHLAFGLVPLGGPSWSLPEGTYDMRAAAVINGAPEILSAPVTIQVLGGSVVQGDFRGETFDFAAMSGDGVVVHGAGGTDTLRLPVSFASLARLNGTIPGAINYQPSKGGEAIYRGIAVDHLLLADGREIYLTGIERLVFESKGEVTTLELAIEPNDPRFPDQWNLHATDVPSAWRYSTGSDDVLIVSLDQGVFPNPIVFPESYQGQLHDLAASRLISDTIMHEGLPVDLGVADAQLNEYPFEGHGHRAVSIMAANWSNASLIAGINAGSDIFVSNVYHALNALHEAIARALFSPAAAGRKLVFQGGVQGEMWTVGGTQNPTHTLAELENLVSGASSRALFVFAAGNYGPGGAPPEGDPLSYLTSVSGVAKLETNHANVMSVGALTHIQRDQGGTVTIHGMSNALDVNIATYSNRGPNLTIMAPTDCLSTSLLSDQASIFRGTSAANPNLAGIASLVWSVAPNLTGPEVRDVITSTAIDLGDLGRDNTFGHGLVNADLAVRRAKALATNPLVANFIYRYPVFHGLQFRMENRNLTITGDSAERDLNIQDRGDGAITIRSTAERISNSLLGVAGVNGQFGRGAETINYEYLGGADKVAAWAVFDLGAGNDRFVFQALGGLGTVRGRYLPLLRVQGGDGNDELRFTAAGLLSGDFALLMAGGAGNDELSADFALSPRSRGRVAALLAGGAGDDFLGLFLPTPSDALDVFGFIDGGDGFDTGIATRNVLARSVERLIRV